MIENEEFSIFYQATLGQHELLYGAQIDGLLAIDGKVPDPPKTADVDINISYLNSQCFLELKTNREIQNQRQELNFKYDYYYPTLLGRKWFPICLNLIIG